MRVWLFKSILTCGAWELVRFEALLRRADQARIHLGPIHNIITLSYIVSGGGERRRPLKS
jgi:hypothetical protein